MFNNFKRLSIDCPSLTALLPYRYYDEQMGLFINKKSIGFALSLPPLLGADEVLVTALSDVLKDQIPEKDVDMTVLMWGSHLIGEKIDRSQQEFLEDNLLYKTLYARQRDFLMQASQSSFSSQHSIKVYLRDYQCFIFVSKTIESYSDRALDKISKLRDIVASIFKKYGAMPLSPEQLISLIREWMQPSLTTLIPHKVHYQQHETLDQSILSASVSLLVNDESLDISHVAEGETHHSRVINLSVEQFPDEFALWMSPDTLANLLRLTEQLTCPFLWSVSFRIEPKEKSTFKASRKVTNLSAKAKGIYATLFPSVVDIAKDWRAVQVGLDRDEFKLAKVFFNLTLFSTEKNAEMDQAAAISAFRANGFKLTNTRYLQLQSFLVNLPFMTSEGLFDDLKKMGRLRTLTTWNLANMLPLIMDTKGASSGIVVPTLRSQFACFDPFSGMGDNANMAIAATSGSGKSFLTQAIITNMLSRGGCVFVIDMGESYKKLCERLGGVYLTADSLSLNPFSAVSSMKDDGEMIRDLLSVMASPNQGISDVQRAHLLEAIQHVFEATGKESTIDDVISRLININQEKQDNRLHDMVTLLSKFATTGMYGAMFNGSSQISKDNNFIVLDLTALSKKNDLLKAVLFSLMMTIRERMYLSDRSQMKACFIDEAWKLFAGDNPDAAKFIEEGFRTVRKYNGLFCVINQGIDNFFTSREAKAAWNNSANKIILKQDVRGFDVFNQEYPNQFTAFEKNIIRSFPSAKQAGFSSFMIDCSGTKSFHRLFVDPYSRILYSTDPKEFQAVEDYLSEGISIEEAIQKVATLRFPYEVVTQEGTHEY